MARKLKAWGGLTYNRRNPLPNGNTQIRTVVCAATKKRAVELLDCSMYYFNDYCCQTGNDRELALLERGEGVYVDRTDDCPGRDWEKIA